MATAKFTSAVFFLRCAASKNTYFCHAPFKGARLKSSAPVRAQLKDLLGGVVKGHRQSERLKPDHRGSGHTPESCNQSPSAPRDWAGLTRQAAPLSMSGSWKAGTNLT